MLWRSYSNSKKNWNKANKKSSDNNGVVQKVQSKKEIHHAHKKNQLPPFLEQNQDVTATIKQYWKEHVGELSVELVFDYLHHTILPNLVKDIYGSSKEVLGEKK